MNHSASTFRSLLKKKHVRIGMADSEKEFDEYYNLHGKILAKTLKANILQIFMQYFNRQRRVSIRITAF